MKQMFFPGILSDDSVEKYYFWDILTPTTSLNYGLDPARFDTDFFRSNYAL